MQFKLSHNVAIIMLILGLANTTFADKNAGRTLAPTKLAPELKNTLAEMYKRMADCLRTDKTFGACRHEACNCQVLDAIGHCPIKEQLTAASER